MKISSTPSNTRKSRTTAAKKRDVQEEVFKMVRKDAEEKFEAAPKRVQAKVKAAAKKILPAPLPADDEGMTVERV